VGRRRRGRRGCVVRIVSGVIIVLLRPEEFSKDQLGLKAVSPLRERVPGSGEDWREHVSVEREAYSTEVE
jgi:hypothetical protein